METIPQLVIDKAKDLVEKYGKNFRLLEKKNGKSIYVYEFPQNERTGFPYIFIYDEEDSAVEEITGIKALKMLRHRS